MSEAKELESLAPFEEWLQRSDDYGPHRYATPEDIHGFKEKVQAAIDGMMQGRKR